MFPKSCFMSPPSRLPAGAHFFTLLSDDPLGLLSVSSIRRLQARSETGRVFYSAAVILKGRGRLLHHARSTSSRARTLTAPRSLALSLKRQLSRSSCAWY